LYSSGCETIFFSVISFHFLQFSNIQMMRNDWFPVSKDAF